MEFLELLETIRAEEATMERLYRGDGSAVRRRGQDPAYQQRLLGALRLWESALSGSRRALLTLQEAMTTSDFPNLFGDIIDRMLLANYQEAPYSWNLVAKRGTVADFRTVRRFFVNGAEAVLDAVPQQTGYPESSVSDGKYQYAVQKYGRRIPFAWEAMINDDLDALRDIPLRFGKAARRSEEKFVTQLYVSSTGPNATFFSNTNKNLVTPTNGAVATNPALSISGLQDGFTVLSKQTDADGEPIAIEAVTLVIPPALEVTAQNILNATQLWVNGGTSGLPQSGGSTDDRLITLNWMAKRVRLAVNYYLPIVDTSHGNTAWYLFANPEAGRPALEMGFLRGHEMPEIWLKLANAQRIGGGTVNPMDGDFDTDSIQYRVRHVFGGTLMEPKAAVASNGSGS